MYTQGDSSALILNSQMSIYLIPQPMQQVYSQQPIIYNKYKKRLVISNAYIKKTKTPQRTRETKLEKTRILTGRNHTTQR